MEGYLMKAGQFNTAMQKRWLQGTCREVAKDLAAAGSS